MPDSCLHKQHWSTVTPKTKQSVSGSLKNGGSKVPTAILTAHRNRYFGHEMQHLQSIIRIQLMEKFKPWTCPLKFLVSLKKDCSAIFTHVFQSFDKVHKIKLNWPVNTHKGDSKVELLRATHFVMALCI